VKIRRRDFGKLLGSIPASSILDSLPAAAFLSPGAQKEAILNGGFETVGANGLPAGWHITKAGEPEHEEGGRVEVRLVEGQGRDGGRAIQLSGDVSSYPCFFDQDLDAQGNGPLPLRGTISFWYKVLEGTPGRPAITVMSLGPKHRNYPGGFFIPVTFANDGDWHYAQFGYDLSGEVQLGGMAYGGKTRVELAGTAYIRLYIMSFESRFPAPTKFLVDDVQFATEDSIYFAPRLFHLIESPAPDRFEVRLYLRNMSMRPATASLQLNLPPHLTTRGPTEKSIALPPGYVHGLHSHDSSGGGVATWVVHGHRRPGDGISVQLVGDIAERSWTWRRELQPDLRVAHATFTRGLVGSGERVSLQVGVRNQGTANAPPGAGIELVVSDNLKPSSPLVQTVQSEIAPSQTVNLSWDFEGVAAGRGTAEVTVRTATNAAIGRAETWITDGLPQFPPGTEPESWRDHALVNSGNLFLSFGPRQAQYGAFGVYFKENGAFRHLASAPYLGKVIYLENGNEAEKILVYRPQGEIGGDRSFLVSDWKDREGTHWKSTIEFRALDNAEEIAISATLEANRSREILSFQGPHLLVGDGSTGISKQSAQLPGIEWLQNSEASSDHSDIPGLRDQRVPHPNKITVPVMGFVIDGKMVGLMWDPLQQWDSVNDRPAAFFDSPNRTLGQANHLAGLFLPSIPRWVDEHTFKARVHYNLKPGRALSLNFSIIAADQADDISPVSYWYRKHGPPDPPTLDRTYDDELRLCQLTSEPERNVETKILQSLERAEKAMARQSDDGWWPWSFSDTTFIQILNWTWAKNLDAYGKSGDTTIGAYSAAYANRYDNLELFRAARYTGNPQMVAAVTRALKRAEKFTRPEGAQPWELPIHTPDLLASLYGVTAFLEGYRLTGNEDWLEPSRYWARAGLPFLYVWGAADQTHMKGAGIAVYGGSFLDYLLLGQGITWCAMDYADSLIGLAGDDPAGPWKKVAQSILHNVILQHEKTGRNAGQWPDWRDLTKNRVLADVWYTSPQPGELLLKWLGKDPEPQTSVVNSAGRSIRITADGEVQSVIVQEGKLVLTLRPAQQSQIRVAIAGVSPVATDRITTSSEVTVRDTAYHEKYSLAFIRFDRGQANVVALAFPVAN
jgi:hypothetical protein